MKQKRWLAVLLAGTMLATALLSGCGGGAKEESTVKVEDKKDDDGAESSGGEVELELFVHPTSYVWQYERVVEDYMTANPGVKLTLTSAPKPEEVLLTRAQNDDMPDILCSYVSDAAFKNFATNGFFLDLSDQPYMDTMNDGMRELIKIDGNEYGFLTSTTMVGLYYNVDMFEEYGIAEPQTWDELIAASKTLQNNGIIPFYFIDKDDWSHGKLNTPLFANFMAEGGKPFFEKLMAGEISCADDPEFVDVVDKIVELRQYCQPDNMGTEYATGVGAFYAGDCAMMIHGLWEYGPADASGLNFKIIPVPGNTAGESTMSFTADVSYALSANLEGAELEAAHAFLNWLAEPEVVSEMLIERPTTTAIKGQAPDMPKAQDVIDTVDEGNVSQWMQDLWPAECVPEFYKIMQQFVLDQDRDTLYAAIDDLFQQ